MMCFKNIGTARKKIILFAGLLGLMSFVFGLGSCKKFVEVPPSPTVLQSSSVYSNDITANAALAGLYSNIMALNSLNGNITLYGSLLSDDIHTALPNATYDAFGANAVAAGNNENNVVWTQLYGFIYQANNIIENVQNNSAITSGTARTLTGESKFIRALTYFYLVNLYGDVPLVLSTDYAATAKQPRATSTKVYDQIVQDLKDAQTLLGNAYLGTGGRVRANHYAASALLARVYLFQKKWAEAETAASEVIGSGVYSLDTDLNHIFSTSSNEAIFEFQPTAGFFNTNDGFNFGTFSSSSVPKFILTNSLLNAFETGDQRLPDWTQTNTASGTNYIHPYKYKVFVGGPPYKEYYVVLRLAEMYLIRAEARAQQGADLPGALADLNMVRTRAGLTVSAASGQTDILAAIARENRVEFFAEWAHRWLDLKRTGMIDNVLGAEKPNWSSQKALLPVPLQQLQLNPNLAQNPGY